MSFRKITVKSGDEEITMNVTEEEYRNYFRPWWQQKKHEQRNREAMEQNGCTGMRHRVPRHKPLLLRIPGLIARGQGRL